jgi:hypothetical protein
MAPVAVVWTFWAVSVAVFTFPLQHWVIRKLTVDRHPRAVGGILPRLAALVVVLAAALAGVTWVFGDRLFGSTSLGWPFLVFLVTVGSAFTGVQRGVLAGRGRYYATAANIAGENLLRLGVGIAAAAAADTVLPFAAALAVGPVVAVLWPDAIRLPFRSGVREPVLAFLGGLAGGILIAQIILNAGPVVLQAMGGAEAEVTALFLALALFRAPYLLALGVAARLTGPLTELVLTGDRAALRRIVGFVAAGSTVLAAAGLAGGYAMGPWAIDLVFAPDQSPDRWLVGFIAAGSALALGGLGLILTLIAEGKTATVQVTWLSGLAAGGAVLAVWPGDEPARVVAAFVAAEIVAVAAMVVEALLPLSPRRDRRR